MARHIIIGRVLRHALCAHSLSLLGREKTGPISPTIGARHSPAGNAQSTALSAEFTAADVAAPRDDFRSDDISGGSAFS